MATETRCEVHPITPWTREQVRSVALRQSWRSLTFLHWRYDPAQVRRLIPSALELDTFDGAAWIGLVPFEIYNLRGIPRFPETNLRTYVIGPGGSRAVWFFSLDADRLAAVIGARVGYALPYFWAAMRVKEENGIVYYQSRRRWPHSRAAMTHIAVQPGELYAANELSERDHFLTARFRLYAGRHGRLVYTQIEHEPWPLARCHVLELSQTLTEASGLACLKGEPLVHFSADLPVKIGYPRKQV